MRHVHGPRRRPAGALLPGAADRARRPRDHDGRGSGRRRPPPPAPAGLRRARRGPVRLLHPGHPADRAGPARRQSAADATGDPGGAGRHPLPLHRLHKDPRRRGARGAPCCGPRLMRGAGKERFTVVGQPLPKIDAWAKVTGETRFADDLSLPRMAYGKLLRSPHPHALIRRIDTGRARALPGVYGVLTGLDLPPVKFGILPVSQDEEALCTEKVRMVGDAVAAVAAVDEETAERATELIDVEYEVLPALMSIEAALRRPEVRIHEYGDGPNVHKPVSLEFGDVASAFPRAHLAPQH